MAITLDTIVNKVFKVVKNGYDNNEVETFLDEILEEMETREAQTNKLREQAESLSQELAQVRAELEAAKAAAAAAPAPAPVAKPVPNERHTTESFEIVLAKAKSAYEEIIASADARAEEILGKANEEAVSIRANAQSQIADLTEKLATLRKQTSDYYTSVKKVMDAQNASMEQIKRLL